MNAVGDVAKFVRRIVRDARQVLDGTMADVTPTQVHFIPSGVANYWVAVFVFVTQLPGVGRKKVVLADRRGGVGDYTKIL